MKNFFDLTIDEILKLAEGDLADQELATRIARRITLRIKYKLGVITGPEREELINLCEVMDCSLANLEGAMN